MVAASLLVWAGSCSVSLGQIAALTYGVNMSQQGNLLTQSGLAAALRDYLPLSLERACLLGDEIKAPDLCAQHVAALLRTMSTYLPRQVVAPLLEAPVAGKVEGGFVHGTVMFSDISGFTAMSEKLSQLAKRARKRSRPSSIVSLPLCLR